MAGVEFRIQAKGLENVEQQLRKYEFRAEELRPGLRRVGQVIVRSVDKNFEAQGRPQKWKSRSDLRLQQLIADAEDRAKGTKRYQNLKRESTKTKHLRQVGETTRNGPILQQTGDLRKSIVFRVERTSVIVGSPLRYAAIHHFGGVIRPKSKKALFVPVGGGKFLMLKKVVIPARPFLMIQREDESKIEKAMLGHIEGEGGSL
ncbi:phage virion morphogenesis protein [Paenibacillus naphthalenovorans]|uniref:phage virion morphogenesis protein n=1 Tax=Paenibacillus naphthalenovorans TaxID=162209 RepID=UPI0008886D37|nr:phage virion morphogenesis protein [Paenibacillus naphthalenovorans]SDI49269.1 Mu-like prophage protein gpG [Paenibacillus naphthalenovorans]